MTVGSARTQPSFTTITLFVVLVVVFGVGSWMLLRKPTDRSSTGPVTTVVVKEQQQAINDFLKVQPTVALEEKIFVYDGGLIGANATVIQNQLQQALNLPVEVAPVQGITTRDAIADLTPRFRTPPKYFVVDLGRYDPAAGIQEAETILNLTSIVQKILGIGSRAIVIGGVSSDGNTRFAESVRALLPTPARFIDATSLLLTPSLRTSPTELNAPGVKNLGERVVAALR